MAAFGLALQVLQIVPASGKAEVPSAFSARKADQDFLNNLKDVMERREDALDKAAARAEARDTVDTDDDAPRRGEGVSEAAPNHEKRKEGAADDTVESSDSDPVTGGDEVTNEPTSAESDAAPREDEEQPSETADASTKDDTGESVASDTTATEDGDHLNETTARDTVTVTSPAEGEKVVAATGTPSEGENVTATFKATDDTADQRVTVPGDAGEVIEAGTAPTGVSTAPAADPPAELAARDTTSDAPVQPVLATDTMVLPDAGAKDDAPADLAAATPGEELASAASGAMSGTGKGNGKAQENAARTSQTEGPKVVLTPKSDGDVKRPTDRGPVRVASAEQGDAGAAGSSSKSKGFAPTTIPGNRQSTGQTTQTGLQNALASVTDAQGGVSNSAVKLASLVNTTSASPSGEAGAQKAGPTPSATAPLPQAAAAGVANVLALQNASNQAIPLRAAPPPPPPPPNPAAFQVAIHVARALDDGLERINIRLHPANLGRVEVKLEVAQDGRVTATVIADKADTLDMLQRDSRSLERALQDAGLRTDSESLNFGLRDEQDHDETDESGEDDQHANRQNDDGLGDIDMHGVIPPSRPLSAQAGALDIFV